MLAAGRLELPEVVTHRCGLDEMQDAYDVFSQPAVTGALKVALFSEEGSPSKSRPRSET
jgi:alcohol dehydrogenase